MSIEERLLRLEGFAADVREHTRILTELIRRHDQRHDGHDELLRDIETKLAALTDAQIQTESSLQELAAAQAHTDERLDALIDIVRGLGNAGAS
jgi:ABC-type transporter Mla subunit MlaD